MSKWFRLIRWPALLQCAVASSCFRIQHSRFLLPRHVFVLVRSVLRVRGHYSHFRSSTSQSFRCRVHLPKHSDAEQGGMGSLGEPLPLYSRVVHRLRQRRRQKQVGPAHWRHACGCRGGVVTGSAAHVQIRALFNKKPTAKPPPRRNIHYVIIPSKRLLDKVDQDRKMTVAELCAAFKGDLAKFDSMLTRF